MSQTRTSAPRGEQQLFRRRKRHGKPSSLGWEAGPFPWAVLLTKEDKQTATNNMAQQSRPAEQPPVRTRHSAVSPGTRECALSHTHRAERERPAVRRARGWRLSPP